MSKNTIQKRLLDVFKQYTDRIAAEYNGVCMTYLELDQKSNMVANSIVKRGIQKGTQVGIIIEDKLEMISIIIGILKAGCVFVPLDSTYPVNLIKSMIITSDTQVVFADSDGSSKVAGIFGNNGSIETITVDSRFFAEDEIPFPDKIDIEYNPTDRIYIYFTSGTSGKPKAIAGQNMALLHFIEWEIKTFNISKETRISQFTSPCHDPFLRDVFVPLCAGGTICIPAGREVILDSDRVINWLEESRINIIHCTPSMFRIINSKKLTVENFKSLSKVLLAGEKLLPNELTSWYDTFGDRIQLVNLYGPTETTLAKMYYLISQEDLSGKTIPIGKAIDGTRVILLDKNMSICSQGEIGEIYIRTPYRTLGYYNDPELTNTRFIQNPYSKDSGDIIYKTGDLGRVLPDGNIEFIRRADRQIKIRGFRVELSAIENELLKYPEIKECAVSFIQGENNLQEESKIIICKRCGLPSTYPNIEFDENGVCNVCQFYESNKERADEYFGIERDLKQKFEDAKDDNKSEYDCMLLYSGGKDSTYVLYKLVEMGLKVFAYTFDNGYISDTALVNIKNIVQELNVDHFIDTKENMKKIFLEGLKEELSVCNGCFKALRIRSTKLAYKKGIKFIITGFSRGQIFDLRLTDIFRQNIFKVEDVEKKVFEQRMLYHSKNDYVTENFKDESVINKEMLTQVELVDFYRYSNVTKKAILEFLEKKNDFWSNPTDTGFCSSNCMINDVGLYVQRKEQGYDNYTFPTSWEVRTNHIPLSEARKEFESEVDEVKTLNILKELGYEQINGTRNSTSDYIAAYFVSSGTVTDMQLRSFLEQSLADYMIPAYFVPMDKLPTTTNGKLDYKALPDPKKSITKKHTPPRNAIEKRLEEIWCNILGRESVGVEEKFMQSGGNSLLLIKMQNEIENYYPEKVKLADLFSYTTIAALAKYISDSSETPTSVNEDSNFEEEAEKVFEDLGSGNLDIEEAMKIIKGMENL